MPSFIPEEFENAQNRNFIYTGIKNCFRYIGTF